MLYVRIYTHNSVYLRGGEDQNLHMPDKYTGFTINNKMTTDPRREKEYYHCFENLTTERNKPGMIHVYQNKLYITGDTICTNYYYIHVYKMRCFTRSRV